MIEFRIDDIEWELHLVEFDEIDGVGETEYCEYVIKVVKGLKPVQLKKVLIHELTHAYRWSYGLVSEMELLNIPGTEVEEYIANTLEVFGEKIINQAIELCDIILNKKKGRK